jgi:large subunit ribosomal protein L29
MTRIYTDELRELSDEQLLDKYEDLKEELYTMRLNNATGELVDTSEFSKTKKTIARIMTILRERQAEGKK